MSYQIIKQPEMNDQSYAKLAIFSTETDTLVAWDATEGEVLEWFAERAARQARDGARWVTQHVINGEAQTIYRQFTMGWSDALVKDREHGGEASAEFTERTTS
jgi:hypothetical protein